MWNEPVTRAVRRGVGRALVWLEAVNARHPWNHNEHFHGWVVRRVPRDARVVLDVGCGAGVLLGALCSRARAVHGVDIDAGMVAAARERFTGDARVTVARLPFDQVRGHHDAVTMVAVLHHLELEESLAHARELLAPGGVLLVVGLARAGSARDVAVDAVSALLNPLVGMVRHPRRALPGGAGPDVAGMPLRDSQHSVDEVATAARAILPGARVRRRLFFRYTLEWVRSV